MDTSSKNILSAFGALSRAIKAIGTDPKKDWELAAWCSMILFIALLLADVFIFVTTSGLAGNTTPEVKQREVLDRKALLETVLRFEKRKADFEKNKSAPAGFYDPSI